MVMSIPAFVSSIDQSFNQDATNVLKTVTAHLQAVHVSRTKLLANSAVNVPTRHARDDFLLAVAKTAADLIASVTWRDANVATAVNAHLVTTGRQTGPHRSLESSRLAFQAQGLDFSQPKRSHLRHTLECMKVVS